MGLRMTKTFKDIREREKQRDLAREYLRQGKDPAHVARLVGLTEIEVKALA